MLPRIVLVEPQGALNVGSIARVMMNFGFNELFLVNPRCDPQSEDALKMATHAKEILQKAKVVQSLEVALQDCSRVIATTAQQRHRNRKLEGLQLPFKWLIHSNKPNALIFGAEDRGLSNEELEWAQRWVRIPTGAYQTLNLAQSVAICCYELFGLQEQIPQNPSEKPTSSEAEINRINQFLERWADQLHQVGFLLHHTRTERMAKLRSILYRSELSQNDLALLEGIVSQTNWALRTNPLNTSKTLLDQDGQDTDR
ncbi:MAG: RNA methyltransferase [bacterium]